MSNSRIEQPTILVPYHPPECDGACQDVFLYLRPETNGIEVESRMMRVVQSNPEYRDAIDLAYLANLPGSFLNQRRIVESHYHVRIFFARQGGAGFTPGMRAIFSAHFGVDAGKVELIGAYEALNRLGISQQELFNIWVPQHDVIFICGQSVKRYGDLFIVNYDIPAILSKNSIDTDIAVMIFRTTLDYSRIHRLVAEVGAELQKAGLLRRDMPLSRAFHYSKGPFEQILDAAGYLFDQEGEQIPASSSSFYQFLQSEWNFSSSEILGALNQPIMCFNLGGNRMIEEEIFAYTQDDTFSEAAEKLSRVMAQRRLPVKNSNISKIP